MLGVVARRRSITFSMASISLVLDLIALESAKDSVPTIWAFSSTNRRAMSVPEIAHEPSDVELPVSSGTQTYKVDNLSWAVDFINHFVGGDDAEQILDAVVWHYETGDIGVVIGNYLITDQSSRVWVIANDADFEEWLNG